MIAQPLGRRTADSVRVLAPCTLLVGEDGEILGVIRDADLASEIVRMFNTPEGEPQP